MAIRFHIKYNDLTKEDTWIAVASYSTFKEYWSPAISRLNLEWLQLLGSPGLPLLSYVNELPEIVDEFTRLEEHFLDEALDISDSIRVTISERLNEIIQNIKYVQNNLQDIASAYIG